MRNTAQALIVDGHSVGWRAFHAGEHKRKQGFPSLMSTIFFNMLHSALEKVDVSECIVTWDSGESQFRKKMYPLYKANREHTQEKWEQLEEFTEQRKIITQALPLMNVTSCFCPGWEADDLIALWTLNRLRRRLRTVIMSGDRDVWQLLNKDLAWVYHPDGKTIVTESSFYAEFGILPHQWLLCRALSGDKTDNVPGVPGVGIPTAVKIIKAGWPFGWKDSKAEQRYGPKLKLHWDQVMLFNKRLMDLNYSAAELSKVLEATQGKVMTVDVATRNFDRARDFLALQGMAEMVSHWGSWMQPFSNLKGRP